MVALDIAVPFETSIKAYQMERTDVTASSSTIASSFIAGKPIATFASYIITASIIVKSFEFEEFKDGFVEMKKLMELKAYPLALVFVDSPSQKFP